MNVSLSRRDFAKGLGGIVLAFTLDPAAAQPQLRPLPGSLGGNRMLDAWIRIAPDGAITEFGKVVGFPIVSGSRRHQRIKSLLPLCVGLRTNVMAVGCAKTEQGFDQGFTLLNFSQVKWNHNYYLLPMDLRR